MKYESVPDAGPNAVRNLVARSLAASVATAAAVVAADPKIHYGKIISPPSFCRRALIYTLRFFLHPNRTVYLPIVSK